MHDLFAKSAAPGARQTLIKHEESLVSFIPAFVPQAVADRFFTELLTKTPWNQENYNFGGKVVPQPRLTAWYGNASYTYSGVKHVPLPWTSLLLDIKELVEKCELHLFNSVLLNYYRDGRDSVAWHDDDRGMVSGTPIASLSLGATRRFLMKHKGPTLTNPWIKSVELTHGSLLVMAGLTQKHWVHSIPKVEKSGPRINLTFRVLES